LAVYFKRAGGQKYYETMTDALPLKLTRVLIKQPDIYGGRPSYSRPVLTQVAGLHIFFYLRGL
jgi:hypothetical protein